MLPTIVRRIAANLLLPAVLLLPLATEGCPSNPDARARHVKQAADNAAEKEDVRKMGEAGQRCPQNPMPGSRCAK